MERKIVMRFWGSATFLLVAICISIAIAGCSSQMEVQPRPTDRASASTVEASSEESAASSSEGASETPSFNNRILVSINGHDLHAELMDNASAVALAELLASAGPLTISMHDYGNMEKVGPIGCSLPTTDAQITAEPGDIILYQGNQLTIYYDTNSWNFTRIGKIQGVDEAELRNILGPEDVAVTFALP